MSDNRELGEGCQIGSHLVTAAAKERDASKSGSKSGSKEGSKSGAKEGSRSGAKEGSKSGKTGVDPRNRGRRRTEIGLFACDKTGHWICCQAYGDTGDDRVCCKTEPDTTREKDKDEDNGPQGMIGKPENEKEKETNPKSPITARNRQRSNSNDFSSD